MSWSSRWGFRQFVAGNIQLAVFSSHFWFLVIIVLFPLILPLLLLAAVKNFFFTCFNVVFESSNWCIQAIFKAGRCSSTSFNWHIINNLNNLNIKTASLPSKTVHDLVHSSPQRKIVSGAGVYCIHCKNCKLKYLGEISRNFHVLLKEHKRDIRIGNLNNALLQYISQSNHNFDFNSAKMLIYIHYKRLRKIFEAGVFHSVIPSILVRAFIIFLLTWANPF